METCEQEGLELDLVEQMKGLGLSEESDTKEPDVKAKSLNFEVDFVSSKVWTIPYNVFKFESALYVHVVHVRIQSLKVSPMKSDSYFCR